MHNAVTDQMRREEIARYEAELKSESVFGAPLLSPARREFLLRTIARYTRELAAKA
ncbi:MAG: hypothetical protein QM817_13795 [Archangium sp.]